MEKPEYLGQLNAISLAESEAGVYLEAWANATSDEDLACCLRFVAAREASHGETFCRRISTPPPARPRSPSTSMASPTPHW